MKYLLDTNACSEYLRGRNPVTFKVRQHCGDCAVSAISATELFVWGFRTKSSNRWLPAIESFLSGVLIQDVTLDISRAAGSLRANLLVSGQPAPPQDLLIAATAIVHGMVLVTHNVRDFHTLVGLQLEDWQI